MKELLQGFVVGLSVVLASFPLKEIVPEDAFVWSLAAVAAVATAIVRWLSNRSRGAK